MHSSTEMIELRPPLGSLRRRPIFVRDATQDDVSLLALTVAPQELFIRYEMSSALLKRTLKTALDRGDDLIVVENELGRVCGFAWFLRKGTFGTGGYLELIALEPGTDGRGFGAALLEEIERRLLADRALVVPTLFLLVSSWNEGARRFYASHEYQEVGELPGFRRADTVEIICMKQLAD